MWLKGGDQQVLAFIEPKGLRHQWPQDKFDLLEKIVPTWNFSVPICGYVLSANSEAELARIQPGFVGLNAPSVLMYQDQDGAYVEQLLAKLVSQLPPSV